MGNSIIVKRVKGITKYYARNHIREYRKGDFLNIVPEFDNPFDENALAILDAHGNKLGYIDKYSNVEIYQKIKNKNHVAIITSVYAEYENPSIEFEIIYETNGTIEELSSDLFNSYLEKYNRVFGLKRDSFGKNSDDQESLYFSMDQSPLEKGKWYFLSNKDSIMEEASKSLNAGKYSVVIDSLVPYESSNDPDLYYFLGLAYFDKALQDGDFDKAKQYLSKASEAGREDAIIALGDLYLETKEYKKAYSSYKEATFKKMAYAYNNLGRCYSEGYGTNKNPRLAFVYFRMAAEEGISEGLFNAGISYESGEGTPVNLEKAHQCYLKAAEQDNADAIYNLGVLYYDGRYVQQDYGKALKYFEKVIELNPSDVMAYDYVGVIHYGMKNYDEAILWLRKAYDLGNEYSSFELAASYLAAKNYQEAKKWFAIAKKHGIKEAEKYLEE